MTPEYFYIIPGYLRFAAIVENPFEQFYIHFNLSDRLKNPQQIFTVDADTDTVKLIKELVCRGNGIKNQQLTMLSAAYILTSTLLQLPAEVLQISPTAEQRIAKILQFISDNPSALPDNNSLAEMSGMSRNSFIRLFKQQTGEYQQKADRICLQIASLQ